MAYYIGPSDGLQQPQYQARDSLPLGPLPNHSQNQRPVQIPLPHFPSPSLAWEPGLPSVLRGPVVDPGHSRSSPLAESEVSRSKSPLAGPSRPSGPWLSAAGSAVPNYLLQLFGPGNSNNNTPSSTPIQPSDLNANVNDTQGPRSAIDPVQLPISFHPDSQYSAHWHAYNDPHRHDASSFGFSPTNNYLQGFPPPSHLPDSLLNQPGQLSNSSSFASSWLHNQVAPVPFTTGGGGDSLPRNPDDFLGFDLPRNLDELNNRDLELENVEEDDQAEAEEVEDEDEHVPGEGEQHQSDQDEDGQGDDVLGEDISDPRSSEEEDIPDEDIPEGDIKEEDYSNEHFVALDRIPPQDGLEDMPSAIPSGSRKRSRAAASNDDAGGPSRSKRRRSQSAASVASHAPAARVRKTTRKPALVVLDSDDNFFLEDDKVEMVDMTADDNIPEELLQGPPDESARPSTKLSKFECIICLDTASSLTVTHCGHMFCGACLHQAMNAEVTRKICPMCRQKLDDRSRHAQPAKSAKTFFHLEMKLALSKSQGKQPVRRN